MYRNEYILHWFKGSTFSDVKVKEIAVEECLNTASHNGNDVVKALRIVSPDPVDNVQRTVRSKSKEVVRSDGLCFTSFGNHKELGHDSHTLQIYRKCP